MARELRCSRDTVKKAIESAEPEGYTLKHPRLAPVLGPYKARTGWPCFRLSRFSKISEVAFFSINKWPCFRLTKTNGATATKQPARFYVERRCSRVRFLFKHQGRSAATFSSWMVQLSIFIRWMLASGRSGVLSTNCFSV